MSTQTNVTGSEYRRVFMGEAVIYAAKEHPVVLATDGLRSCIGFAGWSPDRQVGFLVHFGGPMQVHDFYDRGVRKLSEQCSGIPSLFQCAIRGGCEKTSASKEIIEALQEGLQSCSIQFQIIHHEPLSPSFILKSLSLDTSLGTFSDYDSSMDPHPRQKTAEEQARDLTFSSFEELAYL